MKIGVIPARGGSKRIPRKNIKEFCGRPIIAWSIEKAINSRLFDKVVVSTDDEAIREVALNFGADVPFLRVRELADDMTTTAPVISNAIEECEKNGWDVEYACAIYPCAPFILIADLVESFRQLVDEKLNFIYPVTAYTHSAQRAVRLNADGKVEFVFPKNELVRTQDLEILYHDAAQFYWGTAHAWKSGMRMHSDGGAFRIPNWRVVDIDNSEDWKRAEVLFKSSLELFV
jgi:pseudaminic acid cytidylyltransferase